MNKKYLLLLFFSILLLTGCNKEVITKCELTSDQSLNGYNIYTKYDIYSEKELVNKVIIKQKISSKNKTILSHYEKQLNELYKNNNANYGGYSSKIINKDGKITSTTTIDYNKMDLKKYVKDNPAMRKYINNKNQVTLSNMIKMYELTGAKCEK